MWNVLRELLALRDRGGRGMLVLVTDVQGHAPQVVGARMLVYPDRRIVGTIGGGAVEARVIDRIDAVLAGRRPLKEVFKLKLELGMCCGGQMEVYMEPIGPADRLVLFGAGHVSQATATIAAMCGFDIVVVDDRSEWNSAERFPTAERCVLPPRDWLATAELGPRDHVLVTTHDHALDKALLEVCAPSAAGYVGMIGSTRKVKSTVRHLQLADVAGDAIERIHMPVGLDILAETPEEIAVSIVGELVRHRRAPITGKQTRGAEVDSLRGA